MDYRIRKVVLNNGEERYYPERRVFLFFWTGFHTMLNIYEDAYHYTLEGARKNLDNYIGNLPREEVLEELMYK